MLVLHQSMCIFKAGLSSQVHMMAGQNVKSTWCIRSQSKCGNNMEFQTQVYIRFIHQKGAEKLVKDELCVAT